MIEHFPEEPDLETRLKRAKMRAWRRGMREMDLILGGFIDAQGANLNSDELDAFEHLLARRDQDLYLWVADRKSPGNTDATIGEAALIIKIRANWRVFEENSD